MSRFSKQFTDAIKEIAIGLSIVVITSTIIALTGVLIVKSAMWLWTVFP